MDNCYSAWVHVLKAHFNVKISHFTLSDFSHVKISQENCPPRHQATKHRPDERVPQLRDQALRSRGLRE